MFLGVLGMSVRPTKHKQAIGIGGWRSILNSLFIKVRLTHHHL